ncbi:hypothetical protein [Asanoa siamensis]|uniref:DUF2750 domain-containing protein n=1 Tax=Asanoa siamensis TaxID=926357 RepID=A0ABQ4CKW3_9ACTN|nr:hypothetical protein [Asanoa siamensis]GIF71906.1 hypothetical protein Asi02nite_14240 [Asanoa siamensis]
MTMANDRETLKATLDGVDGVKGYAYRPRAVKPGDAWPILRSVELVDGLAWQPTWGAIVALSPDERTAAEWVDTHFEELVLALRGPGFPDGAEMALMGTEGGPLFILDITLTTDPE